MAEGPTIKATLLGDNGVGKTTLLRSHTQNGSFCGEYCPTVFDNYAWSTEIDNIEFNLCLWDTQGTDEFDKLRPLSYPGTDVFLLCFSVDSPASLSHIETKWIPEVKENFPGFTKFVVVGTRLDLAPQQKHYDKELEHFWISSILVRKLMPRDLREPLLRSMYKDFYMFRCLGKKLAKQIGASYFECSAITQEGLKDVFQGVCRSYTGPAPQPDPASSPSQTKKKRGISFGLFRKKK